MKKKQQVTPEIIRRGGLTIYFSSGEGYSKPAKHRGYYLSYQGIPKDGGIGAGIVQRTLPGICEQSAENDKLAQAVFSEVEKEIETVFDRIFRREYGSES